MEFIHVFIYFIMYISIDSWLFILYFGLLSNTTFYLFCSNCSNFVCGCSLNSLLCPFDITSALWAVLFGIWGVLLLLFVFVFQHFLLSGSTRCSRLILYISWASTRISHFSKNPCSFYWGILEPGARCQVYSFLLASLRW